MANETYTITANLDTSEIEKKLTSLEAVAETHAKKISEALGKSTKGLSDKLSLSEKNWLASNARQLADTKKTTAQVEKLQERAAIKVAQIHQRLQKEIERNNRKTFQELEKSIGTIGRASTIVFASITAGLGGIAKAALNARDELERIRVSFVGLLGEAGSQQATRFVQTFSLGAGGSSRNDIAAATQTLLQYNNTLAQTQRLMLTLGDAAQGTGTNINQLAEDFGGISQGRFRARSAASYLGAGATGVEALVKRGDLAGAQREFLSQLGRFKGSMASFEKNSGLDALGDFAQNFKDRFLVPIGRAIGPSFVKVFDQLGKTFSPELGIKVASAAGKIADSLANRIVPWLERLAEKLSSLTQADVDRFLNLVVGTASTAGKIAVGVGGYQAAKGLGSFASPIIHGLSSGAGIFGASTIRQNFASYLQARRNLPTLNNQFDDLLGQRTIPALAQADIVGPELVAAKNTVSNMHSAIRGFAAKISGVLTVLLAVIQEWDSVSGAFKDVRDSMDELIKTITLGKLNLEKITVGIGKIFTFLGDAIAAVVTTALELISLSVKGITNAVKGTIALFQFGPGWWERVKSVSDQAKEDLYNWAVNWWNKMRNIFTGTPVSSSAGGYPNSGPNATDINTGYNPYSRGMGTPYLSGPSPTGFVPDTPPVYRPDTHKIWASNISSALGSLQSFAEASGVQAAKSVKVACAATAASYLKGMGFDIDPSRNTFTGDLEKTMISLGAQKIATTKGVSAGEVLFKKTKGPLGGPSHVVTVVKVNDDGTVTVADQKGQYEIGKKALVQQYGYGYRFSDTQFASAFNQRGYLATPSNKWKSPWAGVSEVDFKIGGTSWMAAIDKARLEASKKELDIRQQDFDRLSNSTDKLRQAFDDLQGTTFELKGNFTELRASRAEYFGENIGAASIRADAVLAGINSTWGSIGDFQKRNPNYKNDPVQNAQYNALLSQLAQQLTGGYQMAAQLSGQPGFDRLGKDLGKRVEDFYSSNGIANLIPQQLANSSNILLNAGNQLTIAATMLQSAAGVMANLQGRIAALEYGIKIPDLSGGATATGILPSPSSGIISNSYSSAVARTGNGSGGGGGRWEPINKPGSCESGQCEVIGYRWVPNGSGGSGSLESIYGGQKYRPATNDGQSQSKQGPDAFASIFMPIAQSVANAWANGQPVGPALRSSIGPALGNFLGQSVGGPFGSIFGTLASGFISRIFGGNKQKQREAIKPIPVVIQNWDVLGSMLNITKGSMVRASGAGLSSISQMRILRERVGV